MTNDQLRSGALQRLHERSRRRRRLHSATHNHIVRGHALPVQRSVVIVIRLQDSARDVDAREETLGARPRQNL